MFQAISQNLGDNTWVCLFTAVHNQILVFFTDKFLIHLPELVRVHYDPEHLANFSHHLIYYYCMVYHFFTLSIARSRAIHVHF